MADNDYRWLNAIFDAEKRELDSILPDLPGYSILLLGHYARANVLAKSTAPNKLCLLQQLSTTGFDAELIYGYYDELPFLTNSIDIVVAPHCMEWVERPKRLLQEIYRVILPEGYALFLGFNSLSWFALQNKMTNNKLKKMDQFNIISSSRMRVMLQALGFEIINFKTFAFRPALRNRRLFNSIMFLELLGQLLWPYSGNVYFYLVKKTVLTMTPIRATSQQRQVPVKGRVAEPTTRDNGYRL